MLSEDFNLIELKIIMFFAGSSFPIIFLGISAILIYRLGVAGIIGAALPLVAFPIQTYVGKKNSKILQKVYKNKDARVKICTEII